MGLKGSVQIDPLFSEEEYPRAEPGGDLIAFEVAFLCFS
jgi:hypothetical protein